MEIFRLLPVIHRSSLGELNFTDKKLREKKEEEKKKERNIHQLVQSLIKITLLDNQHFSFKSIWLELVLLPG